MDFRQLHFGRDEPILEPELPIVDTHHHLFDRPALRYLFDDYLRDVRSGHRIVASIFVEAAAFRRPGGPEQLRPLGEIEFANGAAAMAESGIYGDARICAAIVGYADLRVGAAIGEYLDMAAALSPTRLRGIRQITLDDPSEAAYKFISVRPPTGVLQHPEFRNGFRELQRRGLSFDAALFHHQLPELVSLAQAFPDTTIILNHAGHAMLLGLNVHEREAARQRWRENIRLAAQCPNIHCKIGGFGLPFWGFGFEERSESIGYLELSAAWQPYIEAVIDAFGVERCMMESDYPVDSRACGFVPLWNALKHVVRSTSSAEKAALFHRTATRVYRLTLPENSFDLKQAI